MKVHFFKTHKKLWKYPCGEQFSSKTSWKVAVNSKNLALMPLFILKCDTIQKLLEQACAFRGLSLCFSPKVLNKQWITRSFRWKMKLTTVRWEKEKHEWKLRKSSWYVLICSQCSIRYVQKENVERQLWKWGWKEKWNKWERESFSY